MNLIADYYSEYVNTFDGFVSFHNEVINMPRDSFSNTGLKKLRLIAGYLLLCEADIGSEVVKYSQIMSTIHNALADLNYPKFRDYDFENRYFMYKNLNAHYSSNEGRMFRHWMGICVFFGLIKKLSRDKSVINYKKCREYYLSDDNVLIPVARNNLINMNAGENDFLKSLKSARITDKTDYRPASAILRYIREIHRPVTSFEISVLLGRIDAVQNENEIIERALSIGRILPASFDQQIFYFFNKMGWRYRDGSFFMYTPSQQPYFKFRSFILYMINFGLIEQDKVGQFIKITDYASSILDDDISILIADLERLLALIDDDDVTDVELRELILFQRNPQLLKLAREIPDFYQKMNERTLRNPLVVKGKRTRNQLIAELAKIQAEYKCQYANRHTFKTSNGKYYCEAHHILEFGADSGPDITNNLVVLGPEAHKALHFGSTEVIEDVYIKLLTTGALDYNRVP